MTFVLTAFHLLCIWIAHSQSKNSTRIQFASCNHQNIPNAITWKSIVDRNPELFIWTGDVVYLDHELSESSYPYSDYSIIVYVFKAFILGDPPKNDPSDWPAKYELMKDNIKYQELKNLTPIIGTWDDHDVGTNNADYTWPHRDYAKELFLDFLEIPQNDTLRNQQGVYHFYQMNTTIDINTMSFVKTIDIIMLDTRYFARQDCENDILGEVQWQWFENVLNTSLTSDLLLLVSSVQTINNPPLNGPEGWYKYRASSDNNKCDPFNDSQPRLLRLLTQYRANFERLLIISGDVHLAQMLRAQCNDVDGNMIDFYEVTSSGTTHSQMYESPFLEKFSYRLNDFAQEDGVNGCSWLGRNFGELNIEWEYDKYIDDVRIKNVSVEIRDENGDLKCDLDLPIFGTCDEHQYDDNSNDIFATEYQTCYGAETFHSRHGVRSVQVICGFSWFFMVMWPNVLFIMIFIFTCDRLLKCCGHSGCDQGCGNCADSDEKCREGCVCICWTIEWNNNDEPDTDLIYPAKRSDKIMDDHQEKEQKQAVTETEMPTIQRVQSESIKGTTEVELKAGTVKGSITEAKEITETETTTTSGLRRAKTEPVTKEELKEKDNDNEKEERPRAETVDIFGGKIRLRKETREIGKHTQDPSMVNTAGFYGNDDANTLTDHKHPYYKSYGYVMYKWKTLYYTFITVVFLIGFRLIGPYNSEYEGNIYFLVTFGIMYSWQEICFGFCCVYAENIAKNVCIAVTIICVIAIIVSWIAFKEIIISLAFVFADTISIISSIFVMAHGHMPQMYVTILIFQILIAGHKIYSLGSHLIYVHNDVPGHTAVGWYWLVQICLMKIYLQQFIFRSKLDFITAILYDMKKMERQKYKQFEWIFAILLTLVFIICSFYMATNSNDWNEGYVSIGTYLEFSFMFNWPSALFLALWLGISKVQIPGKAEEGANKVTNVFHAQVTKRKMQLTKSIRDLGHLGQLSGAIEEMDEENENEKQHKEKTTDEKTEIIFKNNEINTQKTHDTINDESDKDEEVP